jgi:hypothetical protein
VERDVWLSGRVNGSIIVQESKLQDISSFKAKNFLPQILITCLRVGPVVVLLLTGINRCSAA